MSEWQPIETAPKDGTKVLFWHNGDIHLAWWRKNILGQEGFGGYGWSYAEFSMPTHWMPSPEPPKAETGRAV